MNYRKDGQFKPRLGRIRSLGNTKRARSYLSRVSRAISRAGHARSSGRRAFTRRPSSSGRRRVIVKARVVRTNVASKVSLRKHLDYIRRDEATRAQDKGKLFGRTSDDLDHKDFADRADEDRHHFRFIVSPEDGTRMEDLKPFARDLMQQMSNDLGTRLDWVGAVHHNTEHPHVHIVVRGRRETGEDLVIPRKYIAYGIRERAEDLVTLELGPQTRLEQEQKLGRDIKAERLTRTDRTLIRAGGDRGLVKLDQLPVQYRTHNLARLRHLERMKLAEEQTKGEWKLFPNLASRLKALGERGDTIKSLNKAAAHRTGRLLDADYAYQPENTATRDVAGAVLKAGIGGEYHDQKYVTVDTLDGRIVRVPVHPDTDLSELTPGAIVELRSASGGLKPSDHTIDRIAKEYAGTYSPTLHQQADPRATPGFITAHVRRLEALRRAGLVKRHKDGSWTVSADHLRQVDKFEKTAAIRRPLTVHLKSQIGLTDQVHEDGLTWLDKTDAADLGTRGFAEEASNAKEARQKLLRERGVLSSNAKTLTAQQMEMLRSKGLAKRAASLERQTGKTYLPAPHQGKITGSYTGKIQTPDGPYVVIEKNKSFTLAKWRNVLSQRQGLAVTGIAKAGKISWSFGKGRDKGLVR